MIACLSWVENIKPILRIVIEDENENVLTFLDTVGGVDAGGVVRRRVTMDVFLHLSFVE